MTIKDSPSIEEMTHGIKLQGDLYDLVAKFIEDVPDSLPGPQIVMSALASFVLLVLDGFYKASIDAGDENKPVGTVDGVQYTDFKEMFIAIIRAIEHEAYADMLQ